MAIAGADGSDLQRMGFGPSGSVGVAGPWHPGTHTASVVRPVAPAPSPAVATRREATSSPETLPTESPKPVPAPTVTAAAVPVAYDLLDGAVTYRAPDNLLPSQDGYSGHDRLALVGILPDDDAPRRVIVMLSDPQPIGPTCAGDPAPPDAEALARSIRSDPDLEATAPVATTIGGIPALQMDVLLAKGASSCPWSEHGTSGEGPLLLDHLPFAAMPFFGDRARVWLMDLPEGSGARVLTIAVITDEDSFETVLKSAMPVIRSVGVHPA